MEEEISAVSWGCRVSPNCVGRDECGDPNRNDLNHFLERDLTTRRSKLSAESAARCFQQDVMMFDNFLLFFTVDRATRTYT